MLHHESLYLNCIEFVTHWKCIHGLILVYHTPFRDPSLWYLRHCSQWAEDHFQCHFQCNFQCHLQCHFQCHIVKNFLTGATVSEYPPQDWADNASTSTRSSFTIPEGALRVVPTNSEDTPYEVSSFHESELSTNLLRSLEEDSRDTIEDAIASSSHSNDGRESVPSVVVEESEEFEDSIVIHLSQTEVSPPPSKKQIVAEPEKDSVFGTTNVYPVQSTNPFWRGRRHK